MKYGTLLYLVSKNKNVAMIKKPRRKNDPNSGYCTFPGGKLKDKEKGLEHLRGRLKSIIRESKEEIGIEPINPVLRGVILFDNKDRNFDNWKNPENFLVYIFCATKFKGKPKKSEEGIPITVPLDKINEISSNSGDKKMYSWLKRGGNFFGVIKYKGNEIDEQNTWVDFY